MLKKILALIVLLTIVMFPLDKGKENYTEHVEYIRVGRGDTLEGIAGDFYERDKRGIVWNEYRQEVLEANRDLQNGTRCIQPGDLVEVRYYD